MASKKDISDIKSSINQINIAIGEIRDSVIKSLINDNLQLKDQVRKLEIELADNQQYQRRSNIPSSIKDGNVESTVVDISNKIDVPVSPRDIQAAHRIGRNKDGNVESTVIDISNKIDVPVSPRDIQAAHKIDRDKDGNVESTVVDISNKIDVPVPPRDIQAAHKIDRDKERTIVRFINRKDAEADMSNRHTLKDFDATSVGLEKGTKICIKENIFPFISKIGFMCRKLKRAKHIFSTWMGMGPVHVLNFLRLFLFS